MIRLSYGLSNVKGLILFYVCMFNLQVHIAPFVQKVFARRNYVPFLYRHIYAALKHQG